MPRRSRSQWDELDQLRAFDQEVERLGERRLVADGMENSFNVSWSATDNQLRMTATQHHEDDLRAFCTDYRKFISSDEPVYLPRIYNILEQKLTSENLRVQLRASREAWKHAQEGSGISVSIDERTITPEHIMDVFINGWVFHMDGPKRQEFQRLWPSPLTRFQMNNLIVEACRQLFFVRSIVRVALRDGLVT